MRKKTTRNLNYYLLSVNFFIYGLIFLYKLNNPKDTEVCASTFFILFIALMINIAILVWVAKDAKNRGMDNAVIWMIFVFFAGLIGLVVYLLVRPQGNLVQCPNCRNRKLQAAVRCPHCNAETP